jgi:hypothetical protein
MILRRARKALALLIAEWRYRGKPATLATVRRQIGGKYRKPRSGQYPPKRMPGPVMTGKQIDDEYESKVRAVEKVMEGKK